MLNAAGDLGHPVHLRGRRRDAVRAAASCWTARARRCCARRRWRRSRSRSTCASPPCRSPGYAKPAPISWWRRFRVSDHYVQAMFAGGGMAYADRYMKDPATAPLCRVEPGSVAAGRQLRRAGMPLAGHPEPPRRNRQRDGARRSSTTREAGRPHLSRAHRQGARDLRRRRRLPPGLAAQPLVHLQRRASSATRSACARRSAARGADGST